MACFQSQARASSAPSRAARSANSARKWELIYPFIPKIAGCKWFLPIEFIPRSPGDFDRNAWQRLSPEFGLRRGLWVNTF